MKTNTFTFKGCQLNGTAGAGQALVDSQGRRVGMSLREARSVGWHITTNGASYGSTVITPRLANDEPGPLFAWPATAPTASNDTYTATTTETAAAWVVFELTTAHGSAVTADITFTTRDY